jgi:hypothetical protein
MKLYFVIKTEYKNINMKLTSTGFCPHCKMHTETIRVDTEKCTTYYCIRCKKEPTGAMMPDIVLTAIIIDAEKIIRTLKSPPS